MATGVALVAVLAAARRTDDDLTAMRGAVAELAAADSLSSYRAADAAFHRALSQAARNPLLEQAVFQARASLPTKLVEELKSEGLPVLNAYLSSSIKIRESHEQSRPMIYLDPKHKLTQEFVALHAELP